MKTPYTQSALAGLTFFGALSAQGAISLVEYDFENLASTTDGIGVDRHIAGYQASGVTASTFEYASSGGLVLDSTSRGTSVGDNNATTPTFDHNLLSDNSFAFNRSSSGMGFASTSAQDSIDNNWYMEFSITPDTEMDLTTIAFTTQNANPNRAPGDWFLTSSIAGHTVAAKLASSFIPADSLVNNNVDLPFTDFSVALGAEFEDLTTETTFRIYWHEDSATDNANRDETYIDKVNIIGAVAVPEPSSVALLGLGGLALILRRRK